MRRKGARIGNEAWQDKPVASMREEATKSRGLGSKVKKKGEWSFHGGVEKRRLMRKGELGLSRDAREEKERKGARVAMAITRFRGKRQRNQL